MMATLLRFHYRATGELQLGATNFRGDRTDAAKEPKAGPRIFLYNTFHRQCRISVRRNAIVLFKSPGIYQLHTHYLTTGRLDSFTQLIIAYCRTLRYILLEADLVLHWTEARGKLPSQEHSMLVVATPCLTTY